MTTPRKLPMSWRHAQIMGVVLMGFFLFFLIFTRSLHGAMAPIWGPFAGAVERGGQSCCLEYSWQVFRYSASAVVFASVFQFLIRPRRSTNILRYLVWAAGWTAWCVSSWASLMHAIE